MGQEFWNAYAERAGVRLSVAVEKYKISSNSLQHEGRGHNRAHYCDLSRARVLRFVWRPAAHYLMELRHSVRLYAASITQNWEPGTVDWPCVEWKKYRKALSWE